MHKKSSFVVTVGIVLIVLGVVVPTFTTTVGDKIASVVTTLTAVIGAVALFIQFKKDKQINLASFMTEYSKHFYDTFHCEEVFAKLDKALDNYDLTEEDFDEKLKSDLVNYLIWCEELSALVLQDVLPIKQIDPLFSYRFFLITNNKYVQDFEIMPYRTSYVGLVQVHKMWTEYKRKRDLPIISNENNLTDRLAREAKEAKRK